MTSRGAVKDVAHSLCIHPFMLSRWRKQVRDGELVGDPPPLVPQGAAELQRLRNPEEQLKRLQRDVLSAGRPSTPTLNLYDRVSGSKLLGSAAGQAARTQPCLVRWASRQCSFSEN